MQNMKDYLIKIFEGQQGWLAEALAILVLVIVFNIFIKTFLKFLHKKFQKQKRIWPDSFVRALHKPLSYFIWFVALLYALNLINESVTGVSFLERIHVFLAVGGVLTLGWFFLRWKKFVVEEMVHLSRRKEIAMEAGKVDVIGKLISVVIIFVTILFLLEVSNQSINTLIAFGGIGGLAIAIASQDIIGNFFSGFMIYLTQPFVIGDWILLTDRNIEGHVEEIGWYTTRIRTFDKRPLYIPNSIFSKVVVMNPSRMSHRQIKETIGIRYSDMPVLKHLIHDIRNMLREHPDIDKEQKTLVNFINFGPYSLDIQFSTYTLALSTENYAIVREDILLKIYEILIKNGADMPYPTTLIQFPDGLVIKGDNLKKI